MYQLGPHRFGQYQMLYPQPLDIPTLMFINDLNKKDDKTNDKTDDEKDTLSTSLKDFIKLNYALNLRRMIFMDNQRYYEARMRYYKKKGRNKVKISAYPIAYDSIPRLIESPYYNFSYY
jgi:hypothetical protein